jgi:hypothetical protein
MQELIKFRGLLLFFFLASRSAFSNNGSSLFKDLCPTLFEGKEALCQSVHGRFFKDKNTRIVPVTAKDFGVQDSPLDNITDFRVVEDPNKMPAFAYCYFTFRDWMKKEITPDQMAISGSGFSILKSETKGYSKWLKSAQGKRCVERVKKESEEDVVDLETFFQPQKTALLFVNPIAVLPIAMDAEQFALEVRKLVDHERIHVIQGHCPSIDTWSVGIWAKMSPQDKKSFEVSYPDYKWNDIKIAGREAVAFSHEEDFAGFLRKAQTPLKSCKL